MRPFLTLHDPAQAQEHYRNGFWASDTFYDLLVRHAELTPAANSLRDGRERLDWQTLLARVDALAADFASCGIGAGDRVSMWMPNRNDAIVTFLACSRVGAACNPSLHRSYTCTEIIDLMTELRSSAFVTADGWGADRGTHDLDAMIDQLPFCRKLYRDGRLPMQLARGLEPAHESPDTVAYLAFTSGTTGRPKCVMHSCNTLLSNARDLVRDWNVTRDDVILTLSPISHHIAWVAVGQWLLTGAELVLDDPSPGLSRLEWLEETGATYVLGVPTHAMDILAEQKHRGVDRIGAVRTFYMAGSPIPSVVAQSFAEQGIKPQNVYGMTECSSHQYTHPDDAMEVAVTTCGRGGGAYEVRIWDPENPEQELPLGHTGEIGGRGAALMLGYFDNQHATEKSFNRLGYLMSGDLGSLDANGNLRIEGRSKDLIIRGGHNIYPSRIEALAITHPAVEKAAVFPVADDRFGEKVGIAVIGTADPVALLDHLAAEGLSKFDMPEWFIAMPSLPLTPSGKILKRELTEMARRGDIALQPIRYVTPGNPA